MGGPKKALEAGTIAIQAGIHHIDCAQVYRTEGEVLPAIKAAGLKREDVFVTTKCPLPLSVHDPTRQAEHSPVTHFQGRNAIDAQHGQFTDPDPAIGFEEIKASVKRSIDTMGFIPDLLLIHNPYIPAEGTIGEFWGHLETLVEDGTLKGCSLGLSNFRPVDIEEVMKVAKIKPVVNREYPTTSSISPPLLPETALMRNRDRMAPLCPSPPRPPDGSPFQIRHRHSSLRSFDPSASSSNRRTTQACPNSSCQTALF